MKFDLFNWHEVKPNVPYQVEGGALRVMSDKESAVFIEGQGYEALASVGTSHEVKCEAAQTFTVTAPAETRCFLFRREHVFHVPDGPIFTNMDRRPMESGNLLEVKRAMRQFALKQAAMMRQLDNKGRTLPEPVVIEAPEVAEIKEAPIVTEGA